MNNNRTLLVIVTYNGMQWLKRCLDSVLQSDVPLDLFIIDNGSSDGTVSYLKAFAAQRSNVKLHLSAENLGFGRANNIGIRHAVNNGYGYVYLLNQDAYLEPDTVSRLIAISQKHPEYGILSPAQLQANEQHLDYNFLKFGFNLDYNPKIAEDLYFGRHEDIYNVDFIMAAHWLLPVEAVKMAGAFSPTFPHYGEDNDYCSRMHYHGLKVGICLGIKAIHDREKRKSSKSGECYLSYILALRIVSNVNERPKHRLFVALRAMMKECKRLRSFAPLLSMGKILRSYRSIRANRQRALQPGAFLD